MQSLCAAQGGGTVAQRNMTPARDTALWATTETLHRFVCIMPLEGCKRGWEDNIKMYKPNKLPYSVTSEVIGQRRSAELKY